MKHMPENMSGMAAPQQPQTAMPRQGFGGGPQAPQGQQASAEEQALYERFVGGAQTILHDKDALPKTLQALNTADPADGPARVAGMVAGRVIDAAVEAGVPIPPEILVHGMAEIADLTMELAQEAKVYDYDSNPKAAEAVYTRALDEVRRHMEQRGMIDQEAAKASLAEMQQADADGRLAAAMQRGA